MTDMRRCFTVFGGTGFLGSRIVRHLLDAGHRVRIAARHPERPRDLLTSDRVEPVRADLFDPASLAAALDGADGAVNATSLYVEKGDLTFEAVHVRAAGQLATLAAEARLRRFVQLSGIGSDPEARNSYVRARGRGEQAVRAAFPSVTLIRPAVMFGRDDALLSAIRMIAHRSPVFPLFGRGETRLQPGWVEDVAAVIAQALQVEQLAPCYELAGPRIYSYRELVEIVTGAAGRRARCVAVPFWAWKALATIAERLPGAPLTTAQVALMERDTIAAADMPGMADLGVMPTDLETFLRQEGEP